MWKEGGGFALFAVPPRRLQAQSTYHLLPSRPVLCMPQEHKLSNARKIMIEKRKEEAEQAMIEAERIENERRQQAAREAEVGCCCC